jgi:hypothetical protein
MCLKFISSKFKVTPSVISSDFDAISVVITVYKMTKRRKQAIRDFLLSFGTDMTFRCGLPHSAPGSTKKDSIFGCNGNKCLHLPEYLQGNEVLVIDTPLKVALHSTCKTSLINSLNGKHIHLIPSNSSGVCFNSQAASNKPPYPAMIDSIIECCFVAALKLHVIHIADFGFRLPIKPGCATCPLNIIFTKMEKMRDEGITVELIQLDVAFSVPVGENRLVQFSCHRNQNQKSKQSLLAQSTVKVYPLHQLPHPTLTENGGKTIVQKNVEGTVSLKKNINAWDEERNSVNIGNTNTDECQEMDANREKVYELYRHQNNNEKFLRHLCTRWNIVYSVKIYSTIAHLLLQSRSRFPLTEKSIYALGERSIIQLQALLKHTGFASKMGSAIVRKHGILSRIEFSIRPHQRDTLRTSGHCNDFLLHVCLAALDLCMGREYDFNVKYIDSQITQTKVMSLISEALPYLKYTASHRFNRIYSDPRATAWLQAHFSLLLITTGFAPEYGTKHLNKWLQDKGRWDPCERSCTLERPLIRINGPQPDHTSLPARTKKLLSRFLSEELHLSKAGIKILFEFMDSYTTSNLNPMPWYEKFSLKNKLRLSMGMLNDIIPHLSKFMGGEVMEKDKNDMMRNPSLRDTQVPKEQFDDDPWWLPLGTNDTMTQHQIENTPLPTDPISRSIYSLLQLGTFSDLHSPIFTILLFKFILQCHSDLIHLPQGRGYFKLKPLADQTNSLLEKYVEGGVTLSNKELHQLCLLLNIRVGASRKKDYYLQKMCMKFHFPCAGVEFEVEDIRMSPHLKKMNSILNDVMKSDVVMLQPSTDSTRKRYHRNTDNSTITITNWNKVAQRNQPQLITKQRNKYGYKVLALCVNLSKSPHENNLRKIMHENMTNIPQLHNKFVTSTGLSNKIFKGAHSLEELETSNGFQLLMTGEITTIPKSMAFIPEIILPMASIVYEIDIIFYNKQKKKTYIHVCYQSRSITYKFDGLEITPLIKCLILSFELNGEYSRNELSLYSPSMPIRVGYNDISIHTHSGFDPGIFGGRKRTGTNAGNILPHLTTSQGQTFLDSMCKLMSVLGHTTSDAFEPHDLLGLTSFAEELSTSTTLFTGFSTSVTELNSHLRLPLRTLAKMLRTTDPSQLSHKIICPFFCLKYKMLTAVIVPDRRDKFTFFYGFNSRTEQVECKRVTKYNVLIDQHHAIYLHSANNTTGYYKPIEGHPAHHISFYKTLATKYSHLSDTCLMEILTMFKEAHAIELLNDKELRDDSLRPHDKTAIMYTHVTSATPRGTSLMELLQVGIRHNALMLIFPYKQNGWEACIVHHPLQEESKAESTLATFISQAPVEGIYNQHCIGGMTPVDCESGFYIILYMVIGHRTKSWRHFETSIRKLSTEEDLSHKVKKWVYRALNGETRKNFIPNWLEQIIQVNSNTL